MKKELQNARENYEQGALFESELLKNPLDQFKVWYQQYQEKDVKDPNAFTLATATAQGRVSSRVLLLKGIDQGGFEFYSNYKSEKAKHMAQNPWVSLNFFWHELERQVRVEGMVEKMTEHEAAEYFASRPRASKIGAWVSPQSERVESREFLEKRQVEMEKRFENTEVPKPPHWGGYRVMPVMVEFWQGRPSRLHDRLQYTKTESGWQIERLAP